MKSIYLDIMEKSLSAYSHERISDYLDRVKRHGLTEHGFPRLGANMGILIAYGRCQELKDVFIEIMDICLDEMPRKIAANDFSVREVCCLLILLEGKNVVSVEKLEVWKKKIASFDPWRLYSMVVNDKRDFFGNWALFAAVSEYMRGVCCGIDTSEFVDWQLPSQIANLDSNHMYQDDPPFANHMVYDIMPRLLMTFLLSAGYSGRYAKRIEQALDHTVDLTLKMQSVTGELAFGGRSNQFLHNTAMLISYFELEAARLAKKGDTEKAGELKAAAALATKNLLFDLQLTPISHIKNRYDVSTEIGCEKYGYFDKYMITIASNIYMGAMFADEGITASELSNKESGYIISTSEHFHKTFLSAGGYMIELDTRADFHYDASGLGRVHKKDCPSSICLSTPFSPHPNYVIEGENPSAMSICCFCEKDGKTLVGAEHYAEYTLLSGESDNQSARAVFDVQLSDDILIKEEYSVTENGVHMTLSGAENIGLMLPVFEFDGSVYTKIALTKNTVTVYYRGSRCIYCFDGELSSDFTYYYNRNGRYRVYKSTSKRMSITLEKE